MILLVVDGEPAPQGSKKFFGGRPVEVSKKVKPWRNAVVSAVIDAGHDTLHIDGPVTVSVLFYFKRPDSHYGSRKGEKYLKDTAPVFRATTPDLDKMLRSTFDGLTDSGAIADDKYIVGVQAEKRYSRDGWQGAIIAIEQETQK